MKNEGPGKRGGVPPAESPERNSAESLKAAGERPLSGFAAFLHYKRELYRYLTRRLRNPHDVDDLIQEVYMRLLRIDETKCIRQPLAYLYGIASHVLADFHIATSRDQQNVERETVEELADDPSLAQPDNLAERLNLQQQIERAIANLPALHAAILVLHKRDGLSYEEVAARLQISVHTVEKYLTQAKARVRAMPWER